MAQRSSIALFLATAGLMSASNPGLAAAETGLALATPTSHGQLLAQAVECVPIGEGENCERQIIKTIRPRDGIGGPAADNSAPTPNPGASNGSAKKQLDQIERGDL